MPCWIRGVLRGNLFGAVQCFIVVLFRVVGYAVCADSSANNISSPECADLPPRSVTNQSPFFANHGALRRPFSRTNGGSCAGADAQAHGNAASGADGCACAGTDAQAHGHSASGADGCACAGTDAQTHGHPASCPDGRSCARADTQAYAGAISSANPCSVAASIAAPHLVRLRASQHGRSLRGVFQRRRQRL